MHTEADARMVIDKLQENACRQITNKAQVSTEEPSADGRADYLLKDPRSRPLSVIEAKRFALDPYSAKEQAYAYAKSLNVPFVILTNGQENYFWDPSDSDAKRSLRIEKDDKYVLFLAHALRSLRQGGTAGIIFPNGILFGDTGSHLTVKEQLLKEFDLQAVVILPKGMFEPCTPNPTCFFIFKDTGNSTKNVWFFKVDDEGSSIAKARRFGSQYRNDFPSLLNMWPQRKTEDGRAWLVPAQKIIDNGYNMTLSSLGLIEAETVDHPEPEEILTSVAAKEGRILQHIQEMQGLLAGGNRG